MARKKLYIEKAQVIYPNFSGRPTRYTPKGGKREFSIVIENLDLAHRLTEDGWNVRWPQPEPGSEEIENPHLPVKVVYNDYPPEIYVSVDGGWVLLPEEAVSELDKADIEWVDVEISPSYWSQPENKALGLPARSGISAYASRVFVTRAVNPFAGHYAKILHRPDNTEGSGG